MEEFGNGVSDFIKIDVRSFDMPTKVTFSAIQSAYAETNICLLNVSKQIETLRCTIICLKYD